MRRVHPVLQLVLAIAAVTVVAAPATAFAEKKKKPNEVVVLPDQTVTGRVAGPRVAVEISRLTPSFTLGEPHPPFAEKISQALVGASF